MITLPNFSAEAFFLEGKKGNLFALYYAPPHPIKGGILYIHPFAEEMNKSRRMAALQAREFASLGFAVLMVDLYGCGDSQGDFSEANWALWKGDIDVAYQWLQARVDVDPVLWGLRLGATLVLEYSQDLRPACTKILWQPVINGEIFLNQFLRLRLANDMLSETQNKHTTKDLRALLAQGETLEVAGYGLSRELSDDLDHFALTQLNPGGQVYWLDVVDEAQTETSPAAQKTQQTWLEKGVALNSGVAVGEAFWSTPEITECPDLLRATRELFINHYSA